MTEPLWTPSQTRIDGAQLTRFMGQVEARWGVVCADYDALYAFSIDEMEKFWLSVWDFCGVIAQTRGETVLADPDKMPGAAFFPRRQVEFR